MIQYLFFTLPNLIALLVTGRTHRIDALSAAWCRWSGVEIGSVRGIVGLPKRDHADGRESWDAHSSKVHAGRFVADMGSGPAIWSWGDRVAVEAALAPGIRIKCGRIFLNDELPETMVQAMPGMRLSSFVELPFDFDPEISHVERTSIPGGHMIEFDLEWERVPAPAAWRRPEGGTGDGKRRLERKN